MEKDTSYIAPQDTTASLFQDLGSELDFGKENTLTTQTNEQKHHPLSITKMVTGAILTLIVLFSVGAWLDTTLRNLESNGFLKNITPLCKYYTFGVENFANQECGSYVEAKASLDTNRSKLEQDLGTKLALIIPQKTTTQNPIAQPEVQYILSRTVNRAPLRDIINNFNRIKNSATAYQGKDIDCTKFIMSEKWDLTVSCEFFGFPLLSNDAIPLTSRTTALTFLDKLSDPSTGFTLLDQPKNLEIEKYTSTDTGLRSTFSTRTSLTLRLRYSAPNKL